MSDELAGSADLTPGYVGYWQAPAGGQWAGWAQPAVSASRTNGFAIAGFVLGLLGFVGISAILGIVFSSIALSQIRRRGQEGKGLAISGIVLGSCWLLVVLFFVAAATGGGNEAAGLT